MLNRFLACWCVAALAAGLSLSAVAAAPAYPVKLIRLVLPFPPGGGNDILGRVIAQRAGEMLGQTVLVDNRGGASGKIGFEITRNAAPDGYTLMLVAPAFVVRPNLYRNIGYDPLKDYEPVSLVAMIPELLVVHPSVPANSVKELVTLAKARPGALNYGSGGTGTSGHMAVERFRLRAGIEVVHVPYKGSALAMIDVVAGSLHFQSIGIAASLPHVKAGRLRALATLTSERLPSLPELPTIAEAGYPGLEASTWYGVVAPAKTPRAIVQQLNAVLGKVMAAPDVRERLAGVGAQPLTSSAAEFAAFLRQDFERAGQVIKSAGIKAETE